MYKISKTKDNVEKLEQKFFKELKIKERVHLQEWIAKNPEMLSGTDDELLIIQKEFDGFNDTIERLDLLALDKEGGLVIIENKLDDTGRNVVWQALKYTSYCSTLTTAQIIKIYQAYLDKWKHGEDAKQNLLDFLEIEDDADLLLNRNDQRIIFVANEYRKEVTSTVLWLIKHDIKIQCFRAIPYSYGEDLFLQIEQIIPLPETNAYMIDAKEKEKEVKEKSIVVEKTEASLIKFWGLLKERLNQKGFNYLDAVSPRASFSMGFWQGKGKFSFCLGRNAYRVELYFSKDPDKLLIDTMAKYEVDIKNKFPENIEFQRLEKKIASRIKHEMPHEKIVLIDGKFTDEKHWEDLLSWYVTTMENFYKAVNPIWEKVQKEI